MVETPISKMLASIVGRRIQMTYAKVVKIIEMDDGGSGRTVFIADSTCPQGVQLLFDQNKNAYELRVGINFKFLF